MPLNISEEFENINKKLSELGLSSIEVGNLNEIEHIESHICKLLSPNINQHFHLSSQNISVDDILRVRDSFLENHQEGDYNFIAPYAEIVDKIKKIQLLFKDYHQKKVSVQEVKKQLEEVSQPDPDQMLSDAFDSAGTI